MRLVKVFLFLSLTLLSCQLFAQSNPALSNTIKIGALYNMSGNLAGFGIPSAKGAELAVNLINQQGGILGKPVELVLEDASSDVTIAKNKAQLLASNNQIPISIGLNSTDMVMAIMPPIDKAGKIFLTSGSTSETLLNYYPQSLFFVPFSDSSQARAAAEFAGLQLDAKTALVIYDKNSKYTNDLESTFSSSFTHHDGKILGEIGYTTGDYLLTEIMASIKPLFNQANVIYLASGPVEAPFQINTLRSAGYKGPIIGPDSFANPMLIKEAGRSSNNVYFTSHAYLDPTTPNKQTLAFMQQYKQAYGDYPYSPFSALGYDAVFLAAKAITIANSIDPNKVKQALLSINNYEGATGSISYNTGNHIPTKTVYIIGINNGAYTLSALLIIKPKDKSSEI